MTATLPVAIIGGGPVGLAAAAELLARGLTPLVLEAGPCAAHAVRQWGHVRMFSPWRFNIDPAARALLEARGWAAPDPEAYPTGAELAARYLDPLAEALARPSAPRCQGGRRGAAGPWPAARRPPRRSALHAACRRRRWRGRADRRTRRDRLFRHLGQPEPGRRTWHAGPGRDGAGRPHRRGHPRCAWRRSRRPCRAHHAGGRRRAFGDECGARSCGSGRAGAGHARRSGRSAGRSAG